MSFFLDKKNQKMMKILIDKPLSTNNYVMFYNNPLVISFSNCPAYFDSTAHTVIFLLRIKK
jgi:hypothetical protein